GTVFFRAKGCEKCNNTGYRGRTVIYEIMKMSPSLKELVINKASSDMIAASAVKSGMRTMFDAGIRKVISGTTSLEEVLSTVRTSS
ncbi:MAG: hypothetical protein AB1306_12410, partial [Nitrospirota bacterium]